MLEYAEVQESNTDGFVVIGAGLPRTGTLSTRSALGKLLNGKCYHMVEVFRGDKNDIETWNRFIDGEKISPQHWKEFLTDRGYRCGVDAPICFAYK